MRTFRWRKKPQPDNNTCKTLQADPANGTIISAAPRYNGFSCGDSFPVAALLALHLSIGCVQIHL
ncbi:hypothetical protein [Rugamonas sp.]|uniref:hypothetical protein n=1 Tax=Rugamonas sp. TaxID=1926287 RepID=UPI0025E8CD83|nr:hypothetical protein [Rugamonas sp.]